MTTYKKELVLVTPLIKNEIDASIKIKTISTYKHYFFPVVSYEMVIVDNEVGSGEKRKKQLALLTRDVKPYYTFQHYFQNYRYYVDIIETYKWILKGLCELHHLGMVYGGFGVLQEDSIFVDINTKLAFLHNFQYTYSWKVNDDKDRKDMYIQLIHLSKNGNADIPPYMFLLMYLKKNDRRVFRESDRNVLTSIPETIISRLISASVNESDVMDVLKHYAFCWDVYELTQIYLRLCSAITHNNRYFVVFVDILQSVGGGGVGCLPSEMLDRLDHIIE